MSDFRRKLGLNPFATLRTRLDLRLMFHHLNLPWREIKQLAFGTIADRRMA